MGVFGFRLCVLTCVAVSAILSLTQIVAYADNSASAVELTRMFPTALGDFQQVGSARNILTGKDVWTEDEATVMPLLAGESNYRSSLGDNLRLTVVKWTNDAEAYANFTTWRKIQRDRGLLSQSQLGSIGTATASTDRDLAFFKGVIFARVTIDNSKSWPTVSELARAYALSLDPGEGDIPVLVKHLPNWEIAQRDVLYIVTSAALALAVTNQPIIKEISFEGGTEAVVANYDQSQLVIVEFTTPQFSIDNDSKIWTKIAELKSHGQPTPSGYRRVGNYSVFVFNAPDYKTANALIDQVKYEKVVQWLGDDPHLYERLQKYLTQTSAGVLAAVLKSSGLSLLLCLAAGALIGTMLFRHRRAQKAAAYSDAGGSIRLNLDELTEPANTQRLLKSGSSSDQTPSNS